MAKSIEPLGITPERVVTLRDDVTVLAQEIRSAVKKFDLVLITGGLGPTRDDVTKSALVKAFDTKLVRDRKTLANVKKFFAKIDKPMAPVNAGQADYPKGFKIIANKFGTAPCLHKDTGDCIVFAMPGVPFEMKNLMETQILPRIKKRAPKAVIEREVLRLIGIGESSLSGIVESSGAISKDIEIAYLPNFGQVDIRLTARAKTKQESGSKLKEAIRKLTPVIEPYLFATGEQTLEAAVGAVLTKNKLTLASAESCTGGLFASRITLVPGSSAYFLEGVVTYSNDAKIKRLGVKNSTIIKYGAVSAQTAREMAKGICKKSGADIGVSSTGVAGPSGGTKEKPVGLIYIAICFKGEVETRRLMLGKDRNRNQDRTAKEMMAWLWRKAREEK
jgi:nicotinamide-nucleotide amidase